jgi:toxin ParE1/3/4
LPRALRSRRADDDLLEIWLYIARNNPSAADRVLDRIEKAFDLLASHPLAGPARPDLRPDLRYFVSGSYLILYRQLETNIEVVRVLHGARHLPNLL